MNTCRHGVNPKHCNACKVVRSKSVGSGLSSEQVDNWRAVLYTMLGPFALIMSEDKILAYKNRLQGEIDTLADK